MERSANSAYTSSNKDIKYWGWEFFSRYPERHLFLLSFLYGLDFSGSFSQLQR